MAVRRETIILELEDNASREALQAAAAFKTLDTALQSLDGHATTAGRRMTSMTQRADKLAASMGKANTALGRTDASLASMGSVGLVKFSNQTDRATASIDRFSGRAKLMAQTALVLGPAAAPLGASLVPGIAAMTTGMTGAVAAAISAGLAFAGVGDALDALNDVKLAPTAENFEKLQQAMDELGPAGANFARFLHSIGGELETLQRTAGENLFPGMQQGLESLVTLMPQADRLVAEFSSRLGNLAADSGAALAGPEWESFFSFLETDAAPIFDEFARAAGNVALGLSNMMVAFAPLSRDFASGMLEASRAFASWSADSSNFEDFIDYVRQVGPQVSDFLGSLAEAAVALTQAVAPWGSVVLPAMTTLLDLFTAVAGSPIGPALTTAALAMLTLNKAMSAGSTIMGRVAPAVSGVSTSFKQMRTDLGTVATTWATAGAASERESKRMAAATGRIKGNLADVGKGAGVLGAVGVAATGAAQGIGLQNTAMLGLAGTMAGPWGAAAGAGVGLILDYKAAQDSAAASASSFAATLDQQTGALTANSQAWIVGQFDADQLNQFSEMGLDVGELTNALAGGTEGWHDYFGSLSAGQQDALRGGNWGFGPQLVNDINDVANAVDGSSTVFDANKDAMEGMGGAASGAAKSLAELEAAQRAQNQATLASIDAGTRWGEAIANARKQAAAGTKGFNHLTKAGRANRTAMSQLVGAYNAQSDAVKNSAKGYRSARAEVASVGRQMGLTRERIQQMQAALDKPSKVKVDGKQAMQTADSIRERIGRIPKKTTPQANLKDGASPGIAAILRNLQNLDGKTATVTTTHIMRTVEQTAAINRERANGGFQENGRLAFADGGYGMDGRYYSRQPMLVSGGANILWGEKETGWEAYISGKPGERERNLDILAMAGERLGATVIPAAVGRITAYANGGSRGAGRGSGTSLEKSLEKHGKRLERSQARLEKAVDRSRERLDHWNSKRSELRSEVSGSLKRDWFGGDSGNVWSGSAISGTAAFAQQQWTKQRDDSKLLSRTIANLRKNGAGDAFIAEILRSPDPLAAAQMFNKQSVKGMRRSQSLFLSASRATASAASYTSGVVYGDEQAKATRELRAANKKLSGIEKAIKKNHKEAQDSRKKNGAGKATASGSRSRTRSKRG